VLVRFGFVGLIIALRMARCWRWIVDTAALVHQPAIVSAQVSMMLRSVAFMSPRGESQMSERRGAWLAPHQPCSSGSAHYIEHGASINVGGGMYAPFGVVEKPGAEFLPPADKGRFMVTKTTSDEYVFKVPTLRNIMLTAPYFHTGQAWDLRQAVAVMGASQLGAELTDDDVDKITAFLNSLTGEQPKLTYPILPPSVASTPRPQP
jgi:hypothetical protein